MPLSQQYDVMAEYIKINPADNVAVAIADLETKVARIPAGHKMALRDLQQGENIIKYGFPIGHLTSAVPEGGLVDHTNLKTNLEGLLEYAYEPALTETVPSPTQAFFTQAHPENYKTLVVRVAGYSALFTTLSKSLQDDIINRTEQGF